MLSETITSLSIPTSSRPTAACNDGDFRGSVAAGSRRVGAGDDAAPIIADLRRCLSLSSRFSLHSGSSRRSVRRYLRLRRQRLGGGGSLGGGGGGGGGGGSRLLLIQRAAEH